MSICKKLLRLTLLGSCGGDNDRFTDVLARVVFKFSTVNIFIPKSREEHGSKSWEGGTWLKVKGEHGSKSRGDMTQSRGDMAQCQVGSCGGYSMVVFNRGVSVKVFKII